MTENVSRIFEEKVINNTATLDELREALAERMRLSLDHPGNLARQPFTRMDKLTDAGNFGLSAICLDYALSAIETAETINNALSAIETAETINDTKNLAEQRAKAAKGYLKLAKQADPSVLDTVPGLVERIDTVMSMVAH